MIQIITMAALVVLLMLAAISDLRTRRIPNRLILTGLIVSLTLQILAGGVAGMVAWGLGLLVAGSLFMLLYAMRAMGAGDVKLMAMAGAFLGPASAFGALLTTLVAGGLLAFIVTLRNGTLRHTLANLRLMALNTLFKTIQGIAPQIDALPGSAGHLPYGIAIAVGTLAHLLLKHNGYALLS
ncbi:MAG: prepilin peptidase CpaA [Janthinobacterium sp.]|jgi:prepilin peptidase CpaA